MNHFPIYGTRPPAFCASKGDTADPEQPIDCPHCQRRLLERAEAYRAISTAARNRGNAYHEHRNASIALHFENLIAN